MRHVMPRAKLTAVLHGIKSDLLIILLLKRDLILSVDRWWGRLEHG